MIQEENENLNELEIVPNFSALTTPAIKTEQQATIEGDNMQITVLAPKSSIKAKLKRISSTNDQIELTKKQVASKSKAIAKSKTSVKLKSPESPTKVKPVKNKRVRVIKASSIKSKSVVSETSSVTQI